MTRELREGWYLMTTRDLERVVRSWRNEEVPALLPRDVLALSVEEALAYRDAGNVPDALGRSLRLVLEIATEEDLTNLDGKRLRYEPDAHDAPRWRRAGSKPVNVVPLRRRNLLAPAPGPWWEDPDMAELEGEWQATGRVAGLVIPGEMRSFVFKTIVALRAAGREVTETSVADSVARWLSPDDAERIRKALEDANRR